MLVYLPRPTAVNEDAKKAAAAAKVEFDQKGCVFEPHVLGLMAAFRSRSSRATRPTTTSMSSSRIPTFNRSIAGGQAFTFTPSAAERTPGQVVCDIHPWMTAWWMVLDSPYFAVTDDKGNYRDQERPGRHPEGRRLAGSRAKGGFVTPPSGEDVTIKANDTTVKDFTIDPAKLLPGS